MVAAGWTRDGSLLILLDFEVVLGPVYISLLSSGSLNFDVCSGLFPGHFLSISESNFDAWDF